MRVSYTALPGAAPRRAAGGGAVSFAQPGWGALAAVPRRADPATLHTLAGEAMGTTWSVRLSCSDFGALPGARAAIGEALALVVRQMSHWEPDSDLSRFGSAPTGTRQVLPGEFAAVLGCALHWARESGGAWDPTVAPLVNAWGFGPHSEGPRVPDATALAQARACVGHERLVFDAATRVAVQPGGAQLDLSGIAKGYAVDLVAERLRALGHTDFLVEVGGELAASGRRPGGEPWRVAVAPARAAQASPAPPLALRLAGMAVATSGDLWHGFEHGGRHYSHTIDPRTGEPVAHGLASVTVLHAECMQADALATVLTVLGPQDGLAFARERGVAAMLAWRTPQGGIDQAMTPAFTHLIQE